MNIFYSKPLANEFIIIKFETIYLHTLSLIHNHF